MDYVEATKRQAWCHAHLSLANDVIGKYRQVVERVYWDKYLVPGSDYLAARRGKSRDEDRGDGIVQAFVSADRLTLGAKGIRATLRQHVQDLFGESPI